MRSKSLLGFLLILLLALFIVPMFASFDVAQADTAVTYSSHATIDTKAKTVISVSVEAGRGEALVSFRCGSTFLTATAVEYFAPPTGQSRTKDYSNVQVSGATNKGLTCSSGTLYLNVGTGLPTRGSVNVITRP